MDIIERLNQKEESLKNYKELMQRLEKFATFDGDTIGIPKYNSVEEVESLLNNGGEITKSDGVFCIKENSEKVSPKGYGYEGIKYEFKGDEDVEITDKTYLVNQNPQSKEFGKKSYTESYLKIHGDDYAEKRVNYQDGTLATTKAFLSDGVLTSCTHQVYGGAYTHEKVGRNLISAENLEVFAGKGFIAQSINTEHPEQNRKAILATSETASMAKDILRGRLSFSSYMEYIFKEGIQSNKISNTVSDSEFYQVLNEVLQEQSISGNHKR